MYYNLWLIGVKNIVIKLPQKKNKNKKSQLIYRTVQIYQTKKSLFFVYGIQLYSTRNRYCFFFFLIKISRFAYKYYFRLTMSSVRRIYVIKFDLPLRKIKRFYPRITVAEYRTAYYIIIKNIIIVMDITHTLLYILLLYCHVLRHSRHRIKSVNVTVKWQFLQVRMTSYQKFIWGGSTPTRATPNCANRSTPRGI